MIYEKICSLSLSGHMFFAFTTMGKASEVDSKPFLHPLFTDHDLFHRDIRMPVWRWAAPGVMVAVSFAGLEKNSFELNDTKMI